MNRAPSNESEEEEILPLGEESRLRGEAPGEPRGAGSGFSLQRGRGTEIHRDAAGMVKARCQEFELRSPRSLLICCCWQRRRPD